MIHLSFCLKLTVHLLRLRPRERDLFLAGSQRAGAFLQRGALLASSGGRVAKCSVLMLDWPVEVFYDMGTMRY